MWFSIGIGELILVVCLAVVTVIFSVFGLRAWRWAAVLLAGSMVAAPLSPADPASTILLATLFCLFFGGGVWFGRLRRIADGPVSAEI